jgi:signal transduction histidine kinase
VKWPRTLYGQLLLALLASLLAVQLVGMLLIVNDRNHLFRMLSGRYTAERLAGIVSLVERTPPANRPALLHALNEPGSFLSLREPWASRPVEANDPTFGTVLSASLGYAPVWQRISRPLGPSPRDGSPHGLPPHPPGPTIDIQVRLQDGSVLTWRHMPQPRPFDWPARTLALISLLALIVAVLVGLLVRRLTRPLGALASAAGSLVTNLNQPPLPETGPREVARAARAFNAMQRELKSYLETRAQAMAGVSHDLRLPLTRVRLRLEQIDDEALRGRIEADLAEMDTMIGHTLDYLRAGSSSEPTARLNLDALIESLAEDFEALGTRVNIEGRLNAPVNVRPQALRRCLGNLIDNARRHAGGEIDLKVEMRAGQACIEIMDRGPGIPEALREQVFEPYFRIEASRARSTGGSGLGMAIARAVARAESGDITLHDRQGGGLIARVTLPAGR